MVCSIIPWGTVEKCDIYIDVEMGFGPVVEMAVDIVQRAGLSPVEEWVAALRKGNFYAFVAVLISRVPNLRSLSLDYTFLYMGGYPGRMIECAVFLPDRGHLPIFDKLEKADYGSNLPMYEEFNERLDPFPDPPPACMSDQFAGWFYLPALRHLEIWLRDTTRLKERQTSPDLSNLRTLVLARATIPEEDVPFILSRATSLRNLHLGLAYPFYEGYVFEKSQSIVEALKAVSTSVERLSMGFDHYPVVLKERALTGTEVSRYEHVQATLKKFTRLQTLELPMCLLVSYAVDYPATHDVDVSAIWPDTLREVVLRIDLKGTHENRWDEARMADWVFDVFLLKQRDAVPDLEWIGVRFWDHVYDRVWRRDERRLRVDVPVEFFYGELSRGLWATSTTGREADLTPYLGLPT